MKFLAIISLIVIIGPATAANVKDRTKDKKPSGKVEQTAVADKSVTVTLCVMSGQITVRGWTKSEVRARSTDAEQIELRRVDGAVEDSKPAKRIDVYIDDKSEGRRARGDCQASADVELDVPQGATVQVQTRDGDISIEGVESAYAGSQNGDICIERVAEKIEAGSIGGSISLKDSSGRVSLSSAGGGIEVTNARPASPQDSFEATTVSGDIELDQIGHGKVSAKSVNGNLKMTGSLARGGQYGFTTMSGDVTLAMPGDASFKLSAKLSQDGEIVTDFPLTLTTAEIPPPAKAPKPAAPGEASPKLPPAGPPSVSIVKVSPVIKVAPVVKVSPVVVAVRYPLRHVSAIHGSGDATISVASFSGTLRLQKQ